MNDIPTRQKEYQTAIKQSVESIQYCRSVLNKLPNINIQYKNHQPVTKETFDEIEQELTRIGRGLSPFVKLSFIGLTSVGKSTLINKLIQRDILPCDPGHTTCCFIQLEPCLPPETEHMQVNLKPCEIFSQNRLKELAHVMSEKHLTANDLIRIRVWNEDFLNKNGLIMMDIPGIVNFEEFQQNMRDFCNDTDIFIVVVDATKENIDVMIKNILHECRRELPLSKVIVVWNHWDKVIDEESDDQELSEINEDLIKIGKTICNENPLADVLFVEIPPKTDGIIKGIKELRQALAGNVSTRENLLFQRFHEMGKRLKEVKKTLFDLTNLITMEYIQRKARETEVDTFIEMTESILTIFSQTKKKIRLFGPRGSGKTTLLKNIILWQSTGHFELPKRKGHVLLNVQSDSYEGEPFYLTIQDKKVHRRGIIANSEELRKDWRDDKNSSIQLRFPESRFPNLSDSLEYIETCGYGTSRDEVTNCEQTDAYVIFYVVSANSNMNNNCEEFFKSVNVKHAFPMIFILWTNWDEFNQKDLEYKKTQKNSLIEEGEKILLKYSQQHPTVQSQFIFSKNTQEMTYDNFDEFWSYFTNFIHSFIHKSALQRVFLICKQFLQQIEIQLTSETKQLEQMEKLNDLFCEEVEKYKELYVQKLDECMKEIQEKENIEELVRNFCNLLGGQQPRVNDIEYFGDENSLLMQVKDLVQSSFNEEMKSASNLANLKDDNLSRYLKKSALIGGGVAAGVGAGVGGAAVGVGISEAILLTTTLGRVLLGFAIGGAFVSVIGVIALVGTAGYGIYKWKEVNKEKREKLKEELKKIAGQLREVNINQRKEKINDLIEEQKKNISNLEQQMKALNEMKNDLCSVCPDIARES